MSELEAEIARLARRVRAEPRSTTFVGLADALRRAGRPAEALQALREGFRVHPDHSPGRVGLARVHVAMGNPLLAIEVLDEVVRTDPENLAALSLLCRLLLDEGRTHEARPHLERLRGKAPEDPVLALYAGRAAAPPPEPPLPEDPFAGPRLAERFARKGHYERAASIWRRLVQARPDTVSVRQAAASTERARSGLGDVEEEVPFGPEGRRPLPGLVDVSAALGDEPSAPLVVRRAPSPAVARLLAFALLFGRLR